MISRGSLALGLGLDRFRDAVGHEIAVVVQVLGRIGQLWILGLMFFEPGDFHRAVVDPLPDACVHFLIGVNLMSDVHCPAPF